MQMPTTASTEVSVDRPAHAPAKFPHVLSGVEIYGTASPSGEGITSAARAGWYPPVKAVVEWIAALVLLLSTAPVLLAALVVVKLTSRGPAIYSQTRVGRHGRPFTIYKVRTMAHHCERHTGAVWANPDDPRITTVGCFLRRTHLDELPQLWNVLRGEMSLVGPRPERPEFVPELCKGIPRYASRLAVRPGITGLAQLQLPPDTDLASVRRKLAYDLCYLRNCGPWLDLRILLCTALRSLGIPFSLLRAAFAIPSANSLREAPAGA